MEAITERRTFGEVMSILESLGDTLKLAFEFGGVDANSLNRLKGLANRLEEIDDPEGYLDGFIGDWLAMTDFKELLAIWVKRVMRLFDYYTASEKTILFKPEQLGDEYMKVYDIYDRWRNSILLRLSNCLDEGEMIAVDGTICKKEQPDTGNDDRLDDYQTECFAKLIDGGFMCKDGDGYTWFRSKALLAYTMEKVFCKGNMKGEFPDKKLSEMFGVNRLGKTRSDIHLINVKNPRGADEIDNILG